MRDLLGQFYRDDSGATALEYALMATLVGVSAIFSFRAAGGNVDLLHATIAKAVELVAKKI